MGRIELCDFLGLSVNALPKPKHSGSLVICGSARCVWEDLEKIPQNVDFMAVNDIGMHLPFDLSHWYSNDVEMLRYWTKCRRRGYNQNFQIHSCNRSSFFAYWPWPGQGTSSLNAVYTGIALGYERIYLAGIPLDDSGHYFDPIWVKSNFTHEVPDRDGLPRFWKDAPLKGVKALSGRLTFLGDNDGN